MVWALEAVPTRRTCACLHTYAGDKPTINRSDLVLPPDADGRQRHIRTLDEKLVHRCACCEHMSGIRVLLVPIWHAQAFSTEDVGLVHARAL